MSLTDPWLAAGDARLVVLLDAATPLERRILEDWIRARWREGGKPAEEPEILGLGVRDGRAGSAALARLTELSGESMEPYFVPVRLLWIAGPRGATTRKLLRDLLTTDPRTPGPWRQRLIYRRDPARAQPMAAAGASLETLRARLLRRLDPGTPVNASLLAEFVARQALLALERAESNVRGAHYKVPRLVAEDLLARPAFAQALAEEAGRLGRPLASVSDEARRCLKEMAPDHSTRAADVMAEFGRYLCSRGFDPDVQILPSDLERVRELGRTRPIVFLMTHKSHLDGFLLITLFYDLDLPPVHFFGGINMNFLGLGTLARRSGAIFIRRSFADDPVYKLVLRHFIDYLAEKRYPLLWALEGTRSRTGKLMPPRYGLLNYVVESYVRASATDLILMPVAIVYDQVPEVADYVAESKGAVKRPESASWFMRYLSGLNQPFGRIHVRFGTGVPLAAALGDRDETDGVGKQGIQKLAFQLAVDANRVTPVTASAMVTFVLLAHAHRALTMRELVHDLRALLSLVRRLGLPTTGDIDLPSREVLDRVLSQLTHTGVVALHEDGIEPVHAVPADAALAAAYLKNSMVHFLVTSAITELALARVAETGSAAPEASLREAALHLRDLLKFEFFFADRSEFLELMERELRLRSADWRERLGAGTAGIYTLLADLDPLLAPGVLRPFLESYWIVADALLLDGAADAPAGKLMLKRCNSLGRQRLLQRRIASEESLSRAYFESALQLAGSRGLLTGDAATLRQAREAFAAEMSALVRRVASLAVLAENRRAGLPTQAAGA